MSAKLKQIKVRQSQDLQLSKVPRWQPCLVPLVMAGTLATLPLEASAGNFMDLSLLQFNGHATTVNTLESIVLQLTPAEVEQAGSVFTQEKVDISKGFSTAFAFKIKTPSDRKGAEGLVFVVQSVRPDYVGTGSYGLGYYDPSYSAFTNSVGVEFDTWNTGEWAGDKSDNHIGINSRGDLNELATLDIDEPLNNGEIWYAWIDYNDAQLEVRINQTHERPEIADLAHIIDLTELLKGTKAFVGFTAGTGGAFSAHEILTWKFRNKAVPFGTINRKSWKNSWLLEAGETFRDALQDGSDAPEMVVVPAGKFQMKIRQDDDSFEKKHHIAIKTFAMGRYEVTIGEFRQFVDATGYQTEAEQGNGCMTWLSEEKQWYNSEENNWRIPPTLSQSDDKHPVVCVSWNDALAYTKWLSTQTGQQYRLPTEAEWEYAAREGTNWFSYWWQRMVGKSANCWDCGSEWDRKTAPVGTFGPTSFGFYEMHGNVWEWTCSAYDTSYNGQEQECVNDFSTDVKITYRGGSFNSSGHNLCLTSRYGKPPTEASENRGFRLVRD